MNSTVPCVSIGGSVLGMQAMRGEAAGQRRGRAGGDRLVLLAPRLAEMHVHVDQAGRDDLARGVDDRILTVRRHVIAGDLAVADQADS